MIKLSAISKKIRRIIKRAQRELFNGKYRLKYYIGKKIRKEPRVIFLGYMSLPIGIGEAFRSFLNLALNSAYKNSLRVVDYTIRSADKRKDHSGSEFNHLVGKAGKPDLAFISVNPDSILGDIGYFIRQARKKYSICRMNWELPTFPDRWLPAFEIFDEIWVTSRYEYETMTKSVTKPVIIMPIPVDCKTHEYRDPSNRKKFNSLIMFDGDSYFERKNPIAALEAYSLALGNDPDCYLTVKINNYKKNKGEEYSLDKYFNDRTTLITDTLSREQTNSLIASTDVYISLHRAEGFGLILAEAMSYGVPCIATGWSGNMEFMNNDNSCLVPYNLIKIEKSLGSHYDSGNYWADANVPAAIEYLRRLRSDKEYYIRKSIASLAAIDSTISSRAVLKKFNGRLGAIFKSLGFDIGINATEDAETLE